MPEKKIASDQVKVQLATLTLQNAEKDKRIEALEAENKAFRKQNVELASVIENDLKAGLKVRVMAKSDFKEADLETLSVEQLQQIDETLSRVKGASTTYKSINATGASEKSGRTTVGCLFGKTRNQILEMGGDH